MTKKKPSGKTDDAPAAATPPAPGSQSHEGAFQNRGASAKEPPPFKWKLVTHSDGYNVILRQTIERKDAEEALINYKNQGYYADLRIYPVNTMIPQPKWEEMKRREQIESQRRAKVEAREAEQIRKQKEREKTKLLAFKQKLAAQKLRLRERARLQKERDRIHRQKERERLHAKKEKERDHKKAIALKIELRKQKQAAKKKNLAAKRLAAKKTRKKISPKPKKKKNTPRKKKR